MTLKLKLFVMLSVMLCSGFSGVAWANDTTKINLAKTAIKKESIYNYASPTLKQLINKANKIQYRIDADMGCDVVDNYYLGLGNGGAGVSKLQAQVLKNGVIRATWVEQWEVGRYGDKQIIDFDITCTGNKCVIDNVKNMVDGFDFKKDLQYIIDHNDCQWVTDDAP